MIKTFVLNECQLAIESFEKPLPASSRYSYSSFDKVSRLYDRGLLIKKCPTRSTDLVEPWVIPIQSYREIDNIVQ